MINRDVTFERADGWVVATCRGEIDMANADTFFESILQVLQNVDLGLTLDLSDVAYIDSAGMRALVSMRRALGDRQQRLVLVVPEGSVLTKALEVGGVTAAIPTFASLDAAQAAR